jgi:hypothetical protein
VITAANEGRFAIVLATALRADRIDAQMLDVASAVIVGPADSHPTPGASNRRRRKNERDCHLAEHAVVPKISNHHTHASTHASPSWPPSAIGAGDFATALRFDTPNPKTN